MLSIYRMGENGGSEAYIQAFQARFEALAEERRNEALEKEKSGFGNLTMLPLAASGISMMMISIGVVEAIGGEMYGL